MIYLYGDSTLFPSEDDFIELLRDLVDLCALLLQVDETTSDVARRRDGIKRRADLESAHLRALDAAIGRVFEPYFEHAEASSSAESAARLRQQVRCLVEQTREKVTGDRDMILRESEANMVAQRGLVRGALERFFLRHELPDTMWSLFWKSGIAVPAQARAITRLGLEVTMELDVAGTLWSRPVKVESFDRTEKNISIRLGATPRGWLRGAPSVDGRSILDGYYVTELQLTPERSTVVLRRSRSRPSEGLEIVIGGDGQETVRRLGKDGGGEPLAPGPVDGSVLRRLAARVEMSFRQLCGRRLRLLGARLDRRPLGEIDHPGEIAQRLIDAVSPIVREIRHRSPVGSELVLKRVLGDGHREELFMTRDDLSRKLTELSPARRALFAPFGVGAPGTDQADALGANRAIPTRTVELEILGPAGEVEEVSLAAVQEVSESSIETIAMPLEAKDLPHVLRVLRRQKEQATGRADATEVTPPPLPLPERPDAKSPETASA